MLFDDFAALVLGSILGGAFYGAYCIIFATYLQLQIKRRSGGRHNPLTYVLSALFLLCTIFFVVDNVQLFLVVFDDAVSPKFSWVMSAVVSILYSCVDVISQGVLIYRCWTMWAKKLHFVILPSILSFTSFAIAAELPLQGTGGGLSERLLKSFYALGLASFILSLAVNAIVTSLLVLRLALIHRELVQLLGGNQKQRLNLRPLIAMLVESGMFTFIAQLIWLVFFRLQTTSVSHGFSVVSDSVVMIYGITPTIVIVRVSMSTSYENTTTQMVDGAIHFATNEQNHTSAAGEPVNQRLGISSVEAGLQFEDVEVEN
ncbi:hypothetical protein GALMADRAFT_155579 [Galerina marginata CBS 339.88]|uniref:THH1/TOM1/TOM3 domain-containing protein n=1 Tax=Galerina marginata (strain CBS 339.88) TaxID=685588 RepID=A0A067T3G0_GALM3|nr:hypothetical protein GALMADRAFT_155579 [Galerina marginata CBS 339.88]